MKLHLAGATVLALSTSIHPYAAQAMQASQDSRPDMAVAPAEAETSEVVVTARRREERLQDVPVAITALGTDTLQQASIVQLQDVQQKVSGLTIQPGSFGSNVLALSIRGQRQFDAYITKDPAVGVYFADVIQNRPQGLNAAMYDLANVQVLKGPQGTLFGRNTTGGAMLITPQGPTDNYEGYLVAGVGNYNATRLEGAVNAPFGDWGAIRVAGSFLRRDGYTTSATTGRKFDDEHKDSWRVSLRLNPLAGLENRTVVSGFLADENGTGYKLFPNLVTGFTGVNDAALRAEAANVRARPFWTTSSDILDGSRISTLAVSNITQYEVSSALTFKNIFGYRRVESHIAFDLDGSNLTRSYNNSTIPLAHSREDMTVLQYSDELQALGTLFDGSLDYIVGGYYFLERGRDVQTSGGLIGVSNAATNTYVGNRITIGDPIRNRSLSAFAQVTYRLPFLEGVSLTAGGRLTRDTRELTSRNQTGSTPPVCRLVSADTGGVPISPCLRENRTEFERFTYTLSADWKIRRGLLAYIAHRKGYRAGGFNFAATTPSAFTPFLPEDVTDIEAGLKTDFRMGGGSGTFNLAAYTQNYRNIQRTGSRVVSDSVGNQVLIQTITNAAEARIKGFEAELALRPVNWIEFTMNIGHIDAQYKRWTLLNANGTTSDLTNTQFAGTPKWTVNASIAFDVPLGDSELGLRADVYHQTTTNITDTSWIVSQLRTTPSSILPGYTVLNGRVELRHPGGLENLTLALWARNLTNTRYYLGGSELGQNFGFAADFMGSPRLYGMEARFKF